MVLELIVLGRVPGTNIQITFELAVCILLVIAIALLIRLELKLHRTRRLKKFTARIGRARLANWRVATFFRSAKSFRIRKPA